MHSDSLIQQLADRYPLIFLPYHISQGKFSLPGEPSIKIKDTFEDAEYKENDKLVAALTHYGDFPVVEIYTDNLALKSKARTHLIAEYLMQFYLQFIQYLPLGARFRSHTFFTDPTQFTNDEIRRRQLDLSYIDVELHHMLKEYNTCIAKYNQSVGSVLQLNYFTIEELKSLIAMCDVYKGIGCSAALTTERTPEGHEVNRLIRNLDWSTLSVLGSYSLGNMTLTPHTTPDKPRAVFSIGLTPGLLGLSLANDRGLVLTVNEATTMATKRENSYLNATPQFILSRKIIENCSTVAEVKAYLETNKPASSHILTVMDAQGSGGIFEMLPNLGVNSDKLYRFRPFDKDQRKLHVTNHFLDENNRPLNGTETGSDSFTRYDAMSAALNRNDTPLDIAKSVSTPHTLQTLIFRSEEGQLAVDINIANGYSAQALTEDHQQQYTHINLTEAFATFLQKPKITEYEEKEADIRLLNLLRLSHTVAQYNMPLSRELSHLYSALTLELSKQPTHEAVLTEVQIKRVANKACAAVAKVLNPSLDIAEKARAIENFDKLTRSIYATIPKDYLPFIKELAYGAIFGGLVNTLLNGGNFLTGVVLGGVAAATVSSVYQTPGLTTFSSNISNNLKHIVKEEKLTDQLRPVA